MKKLVVTFTGLDGDSSDGPCGVTVSFEAIQSGRVIVKDTVSGKAVTQFKKIYSVDATDDEIIIRYDRIALPALSISAEFR